MTRMRCAVQPPSPWDGLIGSWNFLDGGIAPTFGGAYPVTTRSGTAAMVFNSAGLLVPVAANIPRFNYSPITKACRGLLVEPTVLNVTPYTNQHEEAGWSKQQLTVTADAAAGPFSGIAANLLIEDTSNNAHLIERSPPVALTDNTVYTTSWIVAPAGRNVVEVRLITKAGTAISASFDIANGAILTGASVATIEDYGGGYWRCSVFGDVLTGATTARGRLSVMNGGVTVYTGDGLSGVLLAHSQTEALPLASSPIICDASTVTRNGDIVTALLADIARYDATKIGLRMQGQAALGSFFNQYFVTLHNANDIIAFRRPGTNADWFVFDDAVAQATISTPVAHGAVFRAAGRSQANDFAVSFNGNAVQTDTSGTQPLGMTNIYFGGNSGAGQASCGHLHFVDLFNKCPSNAELQAMATMP